MIETVKPQSSKELLGGYPLRELMLLGGKDGVGKSCGIVSIAWWVEQCKPDARFYVIDTENKFKSAMRSFGADAPMNIEYYKTDDMNQVTDAAAKILAKHKPGDWLGVESMSRIWERAQDLGYNAIAGLDKVDYMEKRKALKRAGQQTPPVTPRPDDLWSIIKGAHDGGFLDLLTQSETLNVVMTTPLSKVKQDRPGMKENQDRKALRVEMGIDANLEGTPRLPYYVETLLLLDLKDGVVSCRVLRDNLSMLESPRVEFEVPNRKSFGMVFWEQCRAGEIRL